MFLIFLLFLVLASFLPSPNFCQLLTLLGLVSFLLMVGFFCLTFIILQITGPRIMILINIIIHGNGRENEGAPADEAPAGESEEQVVDPPVNNNADPAPETNTTNFEDNIGDVNETNVPVHQSNSSGGSQAASSSSSDVVTWPGRNTGGVGRPRVSGQQANVQPGQPAGVQAGQGNAGERSSSGQQTVEAEGSEPSSDSRGGGLEFHGNGHATAAELRETAAPNSQANAGAHGLSDIEEEDNDSATDDQFDEGCRI